jgi:hypothetical protein
MSSEDPTAVLSSTTTGELGRYRLQVGAGTYTVVVEVPGFALFESAPIRIRDIDVEVGASHSLDIGLKIATRVDKIDVPDESLGSSNSNGSMIVLSRQDVAHMPLDPAALLSELQGLGGGPDAQLFVSGFSGGKLPPRSSIGQIRIKQNPYSAENDTDPGTGMIQVSTRAGTDELHGELYLYGDASAMNAQNPFAPDEPGYYAYGSGGSVTGPLNHKASYFAGWDQLQLAMNSAVDAQTLDDTLNPILASYAVRSPRSTVTASSRLDLHPATNSTVMVRYAFDRVEQTNGGVGQLALESQAFSNTTVAQTLQFSNTQLIGTKIVNETRFQYIRARAEQTPASTAPTILVEGAFLGGGNDQGAFSDHQDRYELQNYVSLAEGRHYLNFGGRLRVVRDANYSLANFNGEFIFSSMSAYEATAQGIAAKKSYAEIGNEGGGASEFSLNAGSPNAVTTVADAGLFIQDDWKAKQNLTLSYGLRFETQTYIADHADWAPRAAFSWVFGKPAKSGTKAAPNYMLHGGAGVFYRRFTTNSAMQVQRQNGVTQQEYVVESPDFCPGGVDPTALGCPGIPGVDGLAARSGAATIYSVNPYFRAPYYIGASLGLDRRLGHFGTAGVTYLNNHGVHTQVTENVNAPLPGTYNMANPQSGERPLNNDQNIYQYVSEGVYRSNRLTTHVAVRASRFTVYGDYVLRFDKSDGDINGGFPSNQYDLGADYGRSLNDVRNMVTVGENSTLPFGIQTSGYLQAASGAPFNIVVGQDLNGDTQFNDRPAFATDLTRPSVVATKWGVFDTSPIAGQTIIPRNYGQGPGLFVVNLAVGKNWGVGPEVKGGDAQSRGPLPRRYTVEFWVESQNLLNHPNMTAPIGTLNSCGSAQPAGTAACNPTFGHSLGVTGGSSLSPDRVVDLQLSMRF